MLWYNIINLIYTLFRIRNTHFHEPKPVLPVAAAVFLILNRVYYYGNVFFVSHTYQWCVINNQYISHKFSFSLLVVTLIWGGLGFFLVMYSFFELHVPNIKFPIWLYIICDYMQIHSYLIFRHEYYLLS